jgi:hypothetical protein
MFFCTKVIRWFGTGPTLLISNTSRGFSAIALIWITLSPSLALAQFIQEGSKLLGTGAVPRIPKELVDTDFPALSGFIRLLVNGSPPPTL